MTRGRAWIAVLGVLLVGIVALNVVTLSFAASAGKIERKHPGAQKENSVLHSRDAQRSGDRQGPPRGGGASGLAMPQADPGHRNPRSPDDVAIAAQRLGCAAAG